MFSNGECPKRGLENSDARNWILEERECKATNLERGIKRVVTGKYGIPMEHVESDSKTVTNTKTKVARGDKK